MSDKTYVIYFEGQIEIEADSDDEAVEYLKEQVSMADVGYYKIFESEAYSMKELRIIEEG